MLALPNVAVEIKQTGPAQITPWANEGAAKETVRAKRDAEIYKPPDAL
jgi:hypothetical protein